jgi:transcriptional regulator with XRE-family HTH domain
MNLGTTIKNLRKRKGIDQKSLAEICEITAPYLSQIENSKKNPSPDLMESIAKALNIPVPAIYFLAMETSDIDPKKVEAYRLISKPVIAMIEEFFVQEADV